jgi:predicted NAD/FAD-dependent oxidoreductase
LPDFGFDACQITGHDVSWLSVNNSKPKRGNSPCIVIHSSHDWADQHAFDDRDWMKSHLLSEANDLFNYDFSSAKHSKLHVWLYSNIAKVNDAVYYRDEKMNISACGDWCLRGNVESAYLSGYELAHALMENS